MGSHDTFMLWRLGSVAFKLFEASISNSVNCGHMAANQSAGHAADFLNIGRNVAVASKCGWVETQPTRLVTTALLLWCRIHSQWQGCSNPLSFSFAHI